MIPGTHPVDTLEDLMTNPVYGLGYDRSDFDLAAIRNVCDEVVDEGEDEA